MKRIAIPALFLILAAVLFGCVSEAVDKPLFDMLGESSKPFFESFSPDSAEYMTVNYDQHYAEAIVTDKEIILNMVEALSSIRVVRKTNLSKTDGYHSVKFYTSDGDCHGISFEQDLLHLDGSNYCIENDTAFWRLFKETAANSQDSAPNDT